MTIWTRRELAIPLADIPIFLNPKQLQFHQHQEYGASGRPALTYTYYGGAMGGGKSYAIGASALLSAVEEPGNLVAVFRMKRDDVMKTTMRVFLEHICPEGSDLWRELGIEYNKQSGLMTLHNIKWDNLIPSQIYWGGLLSNSGGQDDSAKKLFSSQWGRIYGDEAFEFPENVINNLTHRMRLQRRGTYYRRAMKFASNPAPCWLSDWFIHEQRPRHLFIPANYQDNLANLPDDYVDAFEKLSPLDQRRYRDGDHAAFEGQVWTGGVSRIHMLPHIQLHQSNFPADQGWELWHSVDPGLNDPTAALWAYYHRPSDTLIFIHEYYVKGLSVQEHAANFKVIEERWGWGASKRFVFRLIDPAAGQRSLASADKDLTVLRLFKREGLYYKRATNSIGVKTVSMEERLRTDDGRAHPLTGDLSAPGVFFVEPTTKLTCRHISGMMWETKGGKDGWRDVNKHLPDAATYLTAALSKYAAVTEQLLGGVHADTEGY